MRIQPYIEFEWVSVWGPAVRYGPLAFHLCSDCIVLCALCSANQLVCCLVKQIEKYNLKY